ncbi:MAG: glutathione synthase [Thioalkalispiraceae bacterium]|jgi:glutathione synthase
MIKLGIVMDPIGSINIKKDSSFAMLLEAQSRNYQIFYMETPDLYLSSQQARASVRSLRVEDNPENWFELGEIADIALAELDVILMRKDPPFNMDYIYSTYILEAAERDSVLIVNRPSSLRDCNEKLFALHFPDCIPPTTVTSSATRIKTFIEQQQDSILKPLGGMGGESIFRVQQSDVNLNVIIESLTHKGKQLIMAQRFIPEISEGDKRILLINGEPIPYALARIPGKGETRGNLAAGGRGEGVALSERDQWICKQVGPRLRELGLLFVGLDVIGDYLTEINVTSPTCIRELDTIYNLNISATLMDCIEKIKQ